MRVWGFQAIEESLCARCNYEQCICGDSAFEAWYEEEMAEQRACDHATGGTGVENL